MIVWGKNDEIFPAAGAYPYMRNLKTVELHLLSTGHFALEEDGDLIAEYIRGFMGKHVRGDAMKAAGKGRDVVSTAP